MNWYIMALKKYAVFNGRARRKEFWYFTLFHAIFCIGFTVLKLVAYEGGKAGVLILDGLYLVYFLALLIPWWAVLIRRLHDVDYSGWWVLVPVVPLVLAMQDSSPGENRFGPNPKDTTA